MKAVRPFIATNGIPYFKMLIDRRVRQEGRMQVNEVVNIS